MDSAAELGDQRTRAVAGPLEKGDLIRLTARGGELAAIAHIARLAAEPPRLRVERELTEIEGAALSVTVAATTPLPDPASVTAAKKAVDDTYAARSKAFKASDVADAEYAEIDAIPAPWWNRKAHVAKVDAAYDRKVAATKAVDITQRAYEMANSTQTTTLRTAATAEVARQAHAKTYARRLDLVMDVRAMLARSPGLAAYGTPALVAIAAEKRDIYLLDWKDLWGVPHPSAESAPWTTI